MVVNVGDQAQAMAKLPAATLPVLEPIPKASAAIRPGEVPGARAAGQGKVLVSALVSAQGQVANNDVLKCQSLQYCRGRQSRVEWLI